MLNENRLALTQENYYSQEADIAYMSYSQFKDFMECEAMAMAVIERRFEKAKSDALLQGSYVDAYFSGELEKFKSEHPELFKKNSDSLLQKYEICEEVIKAIESDEFFKTRFYSGSTQEIITGEIAGVPFKCKIDQLYPTKIVDMKCMSSVDDEWNREERRYLPFWQKYGYHIQAAIYRELYRQKYGNTLPYFLAVATKTTPVRKRAYLFDSELLDDTLKMVESLAPRFQSIKLGETEPIECGHCDYYEKTHKMDIFDIVEIKKEDLR